MRHWQFEPEKQDPITSLGIAPRRAQIETVLQEVQPDSAANKAGLQAGDRIVKVNGAALTQWTEFVSQVRDNPGQALALEIERQGALLSLTLIPDTKPGKAKAEGFAGVVPRLSRYLKSIKQYASMGRLLLLQKPRIKPGN